MQQLTTDVAIIGGSSAGLSAAMALGRSRRNVIVIDSGLPCNRNTPHSHNFLTRDGNTPSFIAAVAREQVLAYPGIEILTDTVIKVTPNETGFMLSTASGIELQSKKIILATGIIDQMPAISGFAECWGISVLHCPYCHGYEVRDTPLAILANGAIGFDFTRLIRQWSSTITLLTNGPSQLTTEQADILRLDGIPIIENPIIAVQHKQGQLNHVEFEGREALSLKAIFARVPFLQSPLVAELELACNENGFVAVNMMQETSIPGIYAAGDCTTPMRAISAAVAAGGMAGAAINHALLLH